MKKEVINSLQISNGMTAIDATLGSGGHSYAIWQKLQPDGTLLSFDRDPEAVAYVEKMYPSHDYPGWERYIGHCALTTLPPASAFLFDSGWSQRQLELGRGFSFFNDEPLDLRLGPDASMTAQAWLDTAKEVEIERVLRFYGGEALAKQIARRIASERPQGTSALASICIGVYRKRYGVHSSRRHPATKTWQALRVFVNQEMEYLENDILAGINALKVGGHAAILSFHSLEDRFVKQLFSWMSTRRSAIPIPHRWLSIQGTWESQDPIYPTPEEIKQNPASRSAVLRVLIRRA